MLSSKVKVKKISNLTDARYFAAWEVDWLGFQLDSKSRDYITAEQMQTIREWIQGPAIIGEFGFGQTLEEIQKNIESLELDGVQLETFHDLSIAKALKGNTLVFKEIVYDSSNGYDFVEEMLLQHQGHVDYFVLNFSHAGQTWEDSNQERIEKWCDHFPVLLDLSFNPKALDEICSLAEGLALAGGEEEKVGFKSFDDLDEIFEALETFED